MNKLLLWISTRQQQKQWSFLNENVSVKTGKQKRMAVTLAMAGLCLQIMSMCKCECVWVFACIAGVCICAFWSCKYIVKTSAPKCLFVRLGGENLWSKGGSYRGALSQLGPGDTRLWTPQNEKHHTDIQRCNKSLFNGSKRSWKYEKYLIREICKYLVASEGQ